MNRNMDTFSGILTNDYGFTVTRLMDVNATRANVVQAIDAATAGLVAGDAFVFAYSGHGSRPVDVNGDEADGYDEALFLYDSDTLGGWKDDYLRNIIDAIPSGVKVTIVIEACYSGTVTRHLRNKGITEEDMREILIASSADNESSWPDFWTKRGVFSNALIKALQASGNKVTVQVLFNRIVASMSAPVVGKPQHPKLEGPAALKQARAFV